jgi:microcystin-dependent protein
MAVPAFASLRRYIGKLLTNTDWDFNFQTITNWLADGTTDLNVNNVTGKAFAGTTGTFSGAVSVGSISGNGSALTGISGTIGEVKDYAGDTDPANHFICDGRELNRGTYNALFLVCLEKFGKGDGTDTFNIPDLRSYIARGVSWGSKTFVAADVGTNIITIAAHNLNGNGRAVQFTGTPPTGITASTTYYVRTKSSSTFEVYDTRAHAIDTSGTTGRLTFTSAGVVGTVTILDVEDAFALRTAPSTGGSTGNAVGSFEAGTVCTSASVTEARIPNVYLNKIVRYA